MTTLLLDASVLLAAFDPEDDHHNPARGLLEDEAATLATLDLARYQVTNVAVRAWRAPESVAPLLAAIERIADDGGVLASTDTLLARAAELAERYATRSGLKGTGEASRPSSLVAKDCRQLENEPTTSAMRAISSSVSEGKIGREQLSAARRSLSGRSPGPGAALA